MQEEGCRADSNKRLCPAMWKLYGSSLLLLLKLQVNLQLSALSSRIGEMPQCPVPWKVWQSMEKIPANVIPFLCHEIDFETMEEVARQLQRGKAVVGTAYHKNTVRTAHCKS